MATKFVSALTGPEMDQALIDMAYHNSEAYAVGTRNGVAVGSSDVTYHNNSKYWAEQVYGYTDRAEDAAERAEAAVPSGTAGAVFFDRAQTLTSAQQSQARANIMAGGSNRNLLDNPWFTVNQRGITSGTFTTKTYGVDRWFFNGTGSYSVTDDGVTITSGGGNVFFCQPFESVSQFVGKTLTASLLLQDGTIKSGTKTFVANAENSFLSFENNGKMYFTSAGVFQIRTNTELAIRAIKIEVGTTSTIANDAPPNYAEELAKCQFYAEIISAQYGFVIGNGFAVDTTQIRVPIKLAPKRGNLSAVTLTGSMKAGQASASMAVSGVTLNAFDPNTGFCEIRLAVTGATIGQMYKCVLDGGSKLLFSADL